jgi:ABC-type sugar transport system ATPase subunit
MIEVDSSGRDFSPRTNLLALRGIRKSFSSVEVLRGVDFDLRPGEIHALIGHNGAGKSTLIKVIAGLFSDYAGTVTMEGRPIALHSPHQAADNAIAVIYQDFALVPEFTVAENIALGREPRHFGGAILSHRQLRERSEQEIREFQLDLPLDVPVRRLGVAGKQMTEIAKALARRARVLIMDEPTARLAPGERERLFAIMRRLAATGVGIIYISHFLDEVKDVADHVTVLRDGRGVASKPADQIAVEEMARLLTGDETLGMAADSRFAVSKRSVPSGRPALRLSGFSVRGRTPVELSLAQGEIIGLAGLVGSGRTSLARAILGDLPSRGTLGIDGAVIRWMTPERAARLGIAMVPEDRKLTGLALQSSIRANMELTALGTDLSRWGLVRCGRCATAVAKAIDRFRILPPDPNRLVGQLSGGNAQKVLLARAALARPKVLLLDQPTAGVDIGAKTETHQQIQMLAREGTAVLLISDDLDELLDLADRIAIMSAGTLSEPIDARSLNRSTLLAAISRNAA